VSSLVRPEFGPPLTVLLRRRAGVPAALTLALVAALVVLGGLVALLVRPGDDGTQLVHEGEPVFNVLYEPDALHQAEPRAGELLRLEGRRGGQTVAVTVQPLSLPAFDGDVSHALLPSFASGHVDQLRARLTGFRLEDEGRARVNDAPGYEVTFRSGAAGDLTYGSDVLLVPNEDETTGAVVISLRRHVTGPLGKPAHELTGSARKAFRSFRYGRERG
jgi:hypothetical protein